MNEPKTPGEVAYEAHAYALVKETGIGTNTWWSSLPEHEVKVWEAVAQSVREDYRQELKLAGSMIVRGAVDMARVRDIRKVVKDFYTHGTREEAMGILEAIFRIAVPLDEPTPEAAGACAEDAGAEPSKSPPPAER